MIAKPFFDRFKSSEQDKPKSNLPSSDEKLLLKLLGFSLKLKNDNDTLLKISRTLSFSLDVSTVCINEVIDNKILARQIFHDEENYPGNKNDFSFDLINSDVIRHKNIQYYENVKNDFPTDLLIKNFKAQSLLSIPAIDELGNITVILNIFHHKTRNYSHYEIESLKLMAERTAQYFQHLKSSTPTQHQEITNNDLQLKKTTEQLIATSKSLESLSFAVSHELRAPLRSMDNFSKALAEDFSDKIPEEAVDYVSRIRKACIRMGHMIDDLLWLSKVTRRKIESQDIELSKLVTKIAHELVADENQRNIELSIQGNLHVNADKGLLKIVIQHLLSNAIKFSRQEEISKIAFFAEEKDGETIFAFRDNGRGFDMTYYDQLFEPFKQLHQPTKYDGNGIGLATVERIIERHHGKIWAESDIDDGATFYFTLPAE